MNHSARRIREIKARIIRNLEKKARDKEMKCRKCHCHNLTFSKWIQWGPRQGKTFCYKVTCNNCNKSYFVSRSKKVYEKVKNLQWRVSKRTQKHLNKYGVSL